VRKLYDYASRIRHHLDSTELQQQDVAMDTGNSSAPLPYNLYWRSKKKIVRQLGTGSHQTCT